MQLKNTEKKQNFVYIYLQNFLKSKLHSDFTKNEKKSVRHQTVSQKHRT